MVSRCLPPTLCAAPGACVGLRLSRTPCDVASRRNPVAGQRHSLPDHVIVYLNNSSLHRNQPPLSAKAIFSLIFTFTHHFADVGKMVLTLIFNSLHPKKSLIPIITFYFFFLLLHRPFCRRRQNGSDITIQNVTFKKTTVSLKKPTFHLHSYSHTILPTSAKWFRHCHSTCYIQKSHLYR